MDAIIFDFDGVLVDSEPTHLAAFRKVLANEGIDLTDAMYFDRYLGYDDHDCFTAVADDFDRDWDEAHLAALTETKTRIVHRMFSEGVAALPGAVEMVTAASRANLPLAICSGALRDEVREAAGAIGIAEAIEIVVAAEDVGRGKPDPEGYLKAATLLAERTGREILPRRCVVCEDSPAGIAAGKAAGMNVLAVSTSYPAQELRQANRVVDNLAAVTLEDLVRLAARKK
jgi:beta-phosphoglucomutase